MKNFLYIHTHDSGRFTSPYGYAVPTPHLLAFAGESLLFRQAYSAAPTCSPSRTGLLSGMAPHTAGLLGLAHRGFRMHDYSQHLASYLTAQGFETVLCGMQHEAPDRRMLGYTRFCDGKPRSDEANADAAADFLASYHEDRPFFLSFGMTYTHRPYPEYPGDICPDHVVPPFPIADTPENRLDTAQYMRSAQLADACAGKVLRALKNSPHAKDTVVLVTTDHGIASPFMKCTLYDTGIGVTMMLSVPGAPAMGRTTDALVSQIDIFPTVCDLLGLPKPAWLQGTSLTPLLSDPAAEIRSELFAEVTYHAAYEPMRCIRTKNFKLIRYYDDHHHPVPANIDDSAPKRMLLEAGYLDTLRPEEQLFDLRIDPAERQNLIGNPQYAAVYDDLNARLHSWMRRTDDPLLRYRHRVPAPGATVNTRTAVQPSDPVYEAPEMLL